MNNLNFVCMCHYEWAIICFSEDTITIVTIEVQCPLISLGKVFVFIVIIIIIVWIAKWSEASWSVKFSIEWKIYAIHPQSITRQLILYCCLFDCFIIILSISIFLGKNICFFCNVAIIYLQWISTYQNKKQKSPISTLHHFRWTSNAYTACVYTVLKAKDI